MKIVVISPHRDDAAFSLGLTIGTWLAEQHTVTVVNCFTRSEYAPYAEFDYVHPNDRMTRVSALRLREDEAWRRMYGRGLRLLDLNLKDAPQRLRVTAEEVLGRAVNPDDKALTKIPKAVAALEADAIVLPMGLGGHVDHVTARTAMLQAGVAADTAMAFYEDLPYAAWAGVADTIEASAAELDGSLQAEFVTEDGAESEARAQKRGIALCYDSQIADEVAEQIALYSERYGGRERLWVNPTWRALLWKRKDGMA